jgi:hypothetical protein
MIIYTLKMKSRRKIDVDKGSSNAVSCKGVWCWSFDVQFTLSLVQVYAVIKEQRGSQGVTICGKADGGTTAVAGSEGRESVVYLSTTNSIEIRILTARSQQNTGGHFLLRYQRK